MVAALSTALPSRPADRILAIADAVLVVGGTGRRRHRRPQPIAPHPCAVLHRRIRHARRRLHLERHHRSRSRCAGRTDAVAADSGGAGERAAGGGLPRRSGAYGSCCTFPIQPPPRADPPPPPPPL